MKIFLYMLCYRFEALVASQLDPEAFGRYMAIGTAKNTRGNVLFFEIDPTFRTDFFRLHDIEGRCTAHTDGKPKASKYVSVYRVMEHVDLSAYGRLHLTTADGRTISLDGEPYDSKEDGTGVNLYDELCPLTPMVASLLGPGAFSYFMTSPDNPVSAPRLFFADLLIDRDESGQLAGYLPYKDPRHVIDCIRELETMPVKSSKTVSRISRGTGFFRTIRRGFFLGDQTGVRVYRWPDIHDLEVRHARWWRSASESLIS